MSVRTPETWLPEFGLSRMDCVKASTIMAEFVVLAAAGHVLEPEESRQLLGSFVFACGLSCENEAVELPSNLRDDLVLVGANQADADSLSKRLTTPDNLRKIYSCSFISRDIPEYGLHKNSKGVYVTEGKFVKKILQLGKR